MFRIALVDDDEQHLQTMRTYINRYEEEENIHFNVTEFHNGLNFVEDYDGKQDVVFLDIEMPHMDGLEAAKKIRQKDQSLGIVFVTNMAQYAIRGYEVNAIDFIVKPIEYYVFVDKLKKALRFSEMNREKEIIIDTEDEVVRIRVSQILYVEKEKNYLLYHTKNNNYRVRGTMAAVEAGLHSEGFSKCINGCLVNLRYVTKMLKDEVVVTDISLPISRHRRKEFKDDFMRYIGGMY